MTQIAANIRFTAKVLRPAAPARASWTFLILPKDASAKLPSRSMTAVEGTINGVSFQATREPDGQKSHWLKVHRKLQGAARAHVGDIVMLEIAPAELEPKLPPDIRKALATAPQARALWSDITPSACRDWIHWITSAKRWGPARVGSTMPARRSLPGSDRFAASIGLDFIAKASALLKRRIR